MPSAFKTFLVLSAVIALPISSAVTAAEYPYSYRSGYFLGRGDTGIAVAEDEEAIFYNPAGVALGKGIFKRVVFAAPHIEVSKDTRDVVREISLQNNDPTETLRAHEGIPQHFGLANFTGIILRKAAIGFYGYSSTSVLLFKDPEASAFETIEAESRTDAGLTFTLGHRLGKSNFYLGTTMKYVQRAQAAFFANATDTDEVGNLTGNDRLAMNGTGTGADLGLMYQSKSRVKFAFGLTIMDVGDTVFVPDEATELTEKERPLKNSKQTVNIGFGLVPGTRVSKIKLLLDFRDILDVTEMSVTKKIHIGTEITVLNVIGMTAGLNQGYPTFGLYADTRVIRGDIGMYTEELGKRAGSRPDTRIFFKLSLGL